MSRLANITRISAFALALAMSSCSVVTSEGADHRPLRVRSCIGDVVPLCSILTIGDDGRTEYIRRGERTLRGRIGDSDLDALFATLRGVALETIPGDERAVGLAVTIELGNATRTLSVHALPDKIVPLLKTIDRIGMRSFGRKYRNIMTQ